MRTIKQRIAAVVIISSDDLFLFGKKDPKTASRYPGLWLLIGGGAHDNETLTQAAVREVYEESGLIINEEDVRPIGPVGHAQTEKKLANGEVVMTDMDFHRFEVRLSQPADEVIINPPTAEIAEFQWFKRSEIMNIAQIPGTYDFWVEAGYVPSDS